jgi:RNA polymerase-binding transcription factor DksA
MPISGSSLNVWHLGADPSKGGKGVGMVRQASGEYCEAVSDERSDGSADISTGGSPGEPSQDSDTRMVLSGSTDLTAIEGDLAAVEAALDRLDAGTYWTDEITGEPLPEALLEENPLLRRLAR